jgi:hypothetical protein
MGYENPHRISTRSGIYQRRVMCIYSGRMVKSKVGISRAFPVPSPSSSHYPSTPALPRHLILLSLRFSSIVPPLSPHCSVYHLSANSLFNPNQSAYTKHHSTETSFLFTTTSSMPFLSNKSHMSHSPRPICCIRYH